MSAPTLHEELGAILRLRGNAWTSTTDLATAVNNRGQYRKRDGSMVEPGQVHLRTRTGGGYEGMFERDRQLVRLTNAPVAHLTARADSGKDPAPAGSSSSTAAVTNALEALRGPRLGIDDAEKAVPSRPGLYAVYGGQVEWTQLGLGDQPDERPLYAGKAEHSLAARDLGHHFSSGNTGRSTLRRSLAALLHDEMDLRGRPRNVAKPADFAMFGLSPEDDDKLTNWMRSRLAIAVWAPSGEVVLAEEEALVVRKWLPPLNLTLIRTPWTNLVSMKRASMAAEARAWRPGDAG